MRQTALLLLFCGWLCPSLAFAGLDPAREAFREAERLYGEGQHAAAQRRFEEAYDRGGPPVCLYNAADSAEQADRMEEALVLWRRYADIVSAEERASALRRLKRLQSKPSSLVLTSEPAGAAVVVDGKATGSLTKAKITLPPGNHSLEFRLGGYQPAARRIRLALGRPLALHVVLAPQPAQSTARLQVRARPNGNVYLDGRLVGAAPLEIDVPAGVRTVEVRAAGYQTHHDELRLDPGANSILQVNLKASPRRIALAASGGVAVPLGVEGLGTGAEVNTLARLEPWPLPAGLGLDLSVSFLQGGFFMKIVPAASFGFRLGKHLAGAVDAGVGYAWAHLSGNPVFTGGRGGNLSGLLVETQLRLSVRLPRGFFVTLWPVGCDVIPAVGGFSATITRLHFGLGLGGDLHW